MTGRTMVRVAEVIVGRAPGELAALGLGSCVAVTLYDPVERIGGMAHVLLPSVPPGRASKAVGRYAQSAVPLLLQQLLAGGAERSRIRARLTGGASMFSGLLAPGLIHMGERNTLAVREALHLLGLRVVGAWVGGGFGRSAYFDLATGDLRVTSVEHGTRVL